MLKEDIGVNAKTIWQLLFDYGMLSITQICKLSRFKEDEVVSALEWLKQDNKVKTVEKGKSTYVELTVNSIIEMYL